MAAVATQVNSFTVRAAAAVAAGASPATVHVFKITGAIADTAANTAGVLVTSPTGISFHEVLANDDGGTVTVEYSANGSSYAALGTSIAFTATGSAGVASADLLTGYYRLAYSAPAGAAAKDVVVVMVAN